MGMMYLAWLEGRSVLKFDLIYCIRSTHMWFDGLETNMFFRELELGIIYTRLVDAWDPKIFQYNTELKWKCLQVSNDQTCFFLPKQVHWFDILWIRGPNPFPPNNQRIRLICEVTHIWMCHSKKMMNADFFHN